MKILHIVHCIDTEGPLNETLKSTFERIHDTFGVKNKDIVNGQTFKYNPVWHQDLVGLKNKLPTLVSSMYMLEVPEKGGATLFASLEKGYENLASNLKYAKYMNLQCCYSTIKALDAQIDHTGYGRIDKYWAKDLKDFANVIQDLVVQPLVVYPDSKSIKKTLMISPNKFYNFLGFTPHKSQEIMREILNACVFVENNTGKVNYEKNDLVILIKDSIKLLQELDQTIKIDFISVR